MKLLVFILATLNPHATDQWLKKVAIDRISGFPCQILDLNFITTDSIIGEWVLYSTKTSRTDTVKIHNTVSVKTRSAEARYFVCSKINFGNNGIASVKPPLGEEEMFNWKLNNDTIYIFYALDTKDRTISHNQYIVKYKKKKEFEELELISVEGNYSYILIR